MNKAGDLNKNMERLKNELRWIKFSDKIDMELLKSGNPMTFLQILHYVFLSYSKNIAQLLVDNNCEIFSKSDKDFIEKIFKALPIIFNYQPSITTKQFFSNGYTEAKLIFVVDTIKVVKQENQNLIKKQYNLQNLKNLKNKNNESFRSAKSYNSNSNMSIIPNFNMTENNKILNFKKIFNTNNNNNNRDQPNQEEPINYQTREDNIGNYNTLAVDKVTLHDKSKVVNQNKNNGFYHNTLPKNQSSNCNDLVKEFDQEINYYGNGHKVISKDDIHVWPHSPKFNNEINLYNQYDIFSGNNFDKNLDSAEVSNHFNTMKKTGTLAKDDFDKPNKCANNIGLTPDTSDFEHKNKSEEGKMNHLREDMKSSNSINGFIPNSVQNKAHILKEKCNDYNHENWKYRNNKNQMNKKTIHLQTTPEKNLTNYKNNDGIYNDQYLDNSNRIEDYKQNKINNSKNISKNFDFNSLSNILNNLGDAVKIINDKMESFKADVEERVGNLEAELTLVKNKLSIYDNMKLKHISNPINQSLYNNTLPNHNQSQANDDYWFSFAADENINFAVSNSLNKNNTHIFKAVPIQKNINSNSNLLTNPNESFHHKIGLNKNYENN